MCYRVSTNMSASHILLAAAGSGALVLAGTAGSLDMRPATAVPMMQQASADVVLSTEDGALPAPRLWVCDEIAAEYNAWIDAGNDPDEWRYANRTYRDEATGRIYSWDDWLDWRETECGCALPTEAGVVAGRQCGVLPLGGQFAANGASAGTAGVAGSGTAAGSTVGAGATGATAGAGSAGAGTVAGGTLAGAGATGGGLGIGTTTLGIIGGVVGIGVLGGVLAGGGDERGTNDSPG